MTLAFETVAREAFQPLSDPGRREGASRSDACSASDEQDGSDEGYFLGRMHASVAQAGASANSIARLVYFELAGRYSIAVLAAGRQQSLD